MERRNGSAVISEERWAYYRNLEQARTMFMMEVLRGTRVKIRQPIDQPYFAATDALRGPLERQVCEELYGLTSGKPKDVETVASDLKLIPPMVEIIRLHALDTMRQPHVLHNIQTIDSFPEVY